MGWALWFSKSEADKLAGAKAPVGARMNVGYCLGLDDRGRVQQYNYAIAGEFSSVAAARNATRQRKGAECVAVTAEPPVCLVNVYGEIQPAGRDYCAALNLPPSVEKLKEQVRGLYEPELKLFK